MKKRLLSLVLALCMVLSLLPGVSFASEQIEQIAVVLHSAQDAGTDTATVKLGFTDGTSGTYTVSRYTDEYGTTHDANFSSAFANNALVGNLYSYILCQDGTVELTIVQFFQSGTAQILHQGLHLNGPPYYATWDSLIFLLYTDGATSRDIQFKVCKLVELDDMPAAAIPVYTSDTSYETLLGGTALTTEDGYDLTVGVMTFGTTPPTAIVAPNAVGYVVDSTVKKDAETNSSYLEVSLIDPETQTLVTGSYPYAPESVLALAPGTKLTGTDAFAIGTILGFAYNGTSFDALETYASATQLNTAYADEKGYYKVTIANATDDRIAFYPYGGTALEILYTEDPFTSVGISDSRPVGSEIEVIPINTVPESTDYNAIIEVDSSGNVLSVFSLYDLMDGYLASDPPEGDLPQVAPSAYAVILHSAYDSESNTATVKLGKTDGTAEVLTVLDYTDQNGSAIALSELKNNAAVGTLVIRENTSLTRAAAFTEGDFALDHGTLTLDGTTYYSTDDTPMFLLYTSTGSARVVQFAVLPMSALADRTAAAIPVYTISNANKDLCGAAVAPTGTNSGNAAAAVLTFGNGTLQIFGQSFSTGYLVESVINYNSTLRRNYLHATLIDRNTGALISGDFLDYNPENLYSYIIGSIVSYHHDGVEFAELTLPDSGTVAYQETLLNAAKPAYGHYKVKIAAYTDTSISFYAYNDTELQTLPLVSGVNAIAIRNGCPIGNAIETDPTPPESDEYNAVIAVNSKGSVYSVYSLHQPMLSTVDGAQIRTSGVQGLRFISKLDKTSVSSSRVVEYGTVLIPSADLSDLSQLKIGATLNGHAVAKVPAKYIYSETDTEITFTAVLINIKEANYAREYTARAYAIMDDGTVVYSDTGASRSIYGVAQRGLQNPNESDANKALFQQIIDIVEQA